MTHSLQLHKKNYRPPVTNNWQGRTDCQTGEYFYQRVICQDVTKQAIKKSSINKKIAMCGFASDCGIKRNQGRSGAELGPSKLRTRLASLACHLPKAVKFYDFGDISVVGKQLAKAQAEFGKIIDSAQQKQLLTIGLGGGHEIAWGHYLGLRSAHPEKRIGIINFDAHFDLRPYKNIKETSSGTPFRQIADDCKQRKINFDYLCLGIQPFANTASLFKFADNEQVQYILAQEMWRDNNFQLHNIITDFIAKVDLIYLSICLDVFAANIAPGVSAPQSLGLMPQHILPNLPSIITSDKLVAVDIAELSPPLDQDDRTAKLAASLIAQITHAFS